MKRKHLWIWAFPLLAMASCIQEEAPNAEADIEYCIIRDKSILINEVDTLFKPNTDHNRIDIYVKQNADLAAFAPEFRLTEGATIQPASGTVHDFSAEQVVEYTVTSEDGQWQKTYQMRFIKAVVPNELHFEHFELNDPANPAKTYYQWFEVMPGSDTHYYFWASGNSGFKMTGVQVGPEGYPTVPWTAGVQGNGVKLETKDTGWFGNSMQMPIAAGNLFLGTFDATYALAPGGGAMKATCFGVPFTRKPLRLKGYYRFKAGETFINEKKEVLDRPDYCDFYGVLYENTQNGESFVLHGDDVLTSPAIVALARIPQEDIVQVDDWTYFDLPFEYRKELDMQRLENCGYNLAVVFSSSVEGASFKGAVGSTLWIDEVSLECE